ncbi:MAG: hypothetical protein ACJAVT_001025 [Yoonia sp.]
MEPIGPDPGLARKTASRFLKRGFNHQGVRVGGNSKRKSILINLLRGKGLFGPQILLHGDVAALLTKCRAHAPTPLRDLPDLAKHIGVARIYVKDEPGRMGLGSFKALGAAYAIAIAMGVLVPAPGSSPVTSKKTHRPGG